jgi:hypothetical protein
MTDLHARGVIYRDLDVSQPNDALFEALGMNDLAYMRSAGLMEHRHAIEAHAGALTVRRVTYHSNQTFELAAEGGVLSAIVEALDADGVTTLDLVAWPLDRPDQFATEHGRADALGIGNVECPSTYCDGKPLRVHKTPLAWFKADCNGCVILNAQSAPRWLGAAPGLISGEDYEHACEIGRMLHPYVSPTKIVAPLSEAA